jgi:RNA polymerase sigma-70 factor (ECF subfamily)
MTTISPARAHFDALVAEHQAHVLRVCRAIVRDEPLANDAAQETFVRLWRRLGAERAPQDSGAWLRRVAVSASIDLSRARRTTPASTEPEQLARVPAETREPLDALASAELVEHFERAVRELPGGQREIFLLRHEGGLSLAEVAESLELALPTVKTQFARAALKLQAKLATFRPPDSGTRG